MRKLGQLNDGLGEGGEDFIGSGIAQALGRVSDVLGRTPKADGDFQIWKVCAQLRAEIARVDDRGGCNDGDAGGTTSASSTFLTNSSASSFAGALWPRCLADEANARA